MLDLVLFCRIDDRRPCEQLVRRRDPHVTAAGGPDEPTDQGALWRFVTTDIAAVDLEGLLGQGDLSRENASAVAI